MNSFRTQQEAIAKAVILIQRLPSHAIWALEVTEDDDIENPTVLNIFADRSEWPSFQMSLRLGKPIDHDETFLSFRDGTLLVSFIELEEDHDE